MKESFQPLEEQPPELQGDWYLQKIEHDGLALKVSISNGKVSSNQLSLDIKFEGRLMAYRVIKEEAQCNFWKHFHSNKNGPGSVYEVINSEWLRSFDDVDFIHYKGVVHYLIATNDDKIDIASLHRPIFSKIVARES